MPESGGGWSLEADPGAGLIVALTFSMVGLGALGVCLGLFALRRGWSPSARTLLWGGLAAAVLLALVPVGGSTDVQSYALYGRMGVLGLDPYRTVPQTLIDAGDPVGAYSPQSWRDTPSVYGPVANGMFTVAAVAGGASMFRIVFLLKLASGAAFALIAVVLHRLARDPARAHLLWTCNPLMSWACVAGAHVDVFGAAAVVLAFAVLLRRADALGPAPAVCAGALIGVAGGIKAPFLLAGLGLVWVARRSPAALAGLAGGAAATGLGSYLLAGPAAFEILLDKAGDVAPTNPWRYLPRWGVELSHEQMAAWGYASGLVVLLVLLWRLPPAGDRLGQAARVSFAFGAALLLPSPAQHPWYDPLIFPLLALAPATRIDGLLQWRLAAGSLGYLPGVPRFTGDPWPDPMPVIRDPVNNRWTSAALGVLAVLVVLVLLAPRRGAPAAQRAAPAREREVPEPV